MLTMVVIDLNECVVSKLCILIPNAHWTTKDNMKLFFVDLYCTNKSCSAKMSVFWKKKDTMKGFSQIFFHISLFLSILSSMVEDC
jgi:hypothetical protein